MKKIIVFTLILATYFFSASLTKAQTNLTSCVWRPHPSNACQADETKEDSSKCPSADRPAAKILSGGEPASAACCCKNINYTPPTPAAPKFIMPDIQIPIPGLDLTSSSSIQWTGNPDGSYSVTIPWISEYIKGIYNYGLSIAGILAAIMLMAGGVLWLFSGGDASRVTQAKELIIGSITGVIILFCSYIILFQINPDLTQLKPVQIGTIKNLDLEPASDEGNASGATICQDCVVLNSDIPFKNGNQINTNLNNKLTAAFNNSNGLAWRVTEAYPPSSAHKSKCHYNGACADVALTAGSDCPNVSKLITIMQNAGLKVLNEYTACNGTQTTYTTGGHLHVQ